MYCTSRQSSQGRQSSYTVQYNEHGDYDSLENHYDDDNDTQIDNFNQATVSVTAFAAAKRFRNIPYPSPIRRQSNRFHNPPIPATQMIMEEDDPFDVEPLTAFHTPKNDDMQNCISSPLINNDNNEVGMDSDFAEDDIEYHLNPNSNSTRLNQTYSTPGRKQLMSDLSQQSI
jgi:hypothetical protein